MRFAIEELATLDAISTLPRLAVGGWRLSDTYLQLFEGRWNEVAAEEFGGQQLPDLIATATQNTRPKPIRHELIRAAATYGSGR